MANKAHCAYCFECLTADFEKRNPASLTQVQTSWNKFIATPRDPLSPAPNSSHPLFVTWNTVSRHGHSLRGCIGTFESKPLSTGLRDFALTSAFKDTRFAPIPASLLPTLQVCVTLLDNFSDPSEDPLDWVIGEHGIRIKFTDVRGRIRGATYLPDVAVEQGWSKEEAIDSLMRKAGWVGSGEKPWTQVSNFTLVRYEGAKVCLDYEEFKAWQDAAG